MADNERDAIDAYEEGVQMGWQLALAWAGFTPADPDG